MPIDDEALELRASGAADVDFLLRLRNESESARYSIRGTLDRATLVEDYLENPRKQSFVVVAAGPAGSSEDVGYAIFETLGERSVGPAEPSGVRFEVSVAALPERRGQGLGTELIRIAARYAISQLGAAEVVARVYEGNAASHKAFERAGFVLEDDSTSLWRYALRRS